MLSGHVMLPGHVMLYGHVTSLPCGRVNNGGAPSGDGGVTGLRHRARDK